MNDLDGGLKFLPKSYFVENNREYLVELIDPYDLKNQISKSNFNKTAQKYSEKKEALIKLADSLKETDNPVLMIVRMKK
jgi:hypothetical protein